MYCSNKSLPKGPSVFRTWGGEGEEIGEVYWLVLYHFFIGKKKKVLILQTLFSLFSLYYYKWRGIIFLLFLKKLLIV